MCTFLWRHLPPSCSSGWPRRTTCLTYWTCSSQQQRSAGGWRRSGLCLSFCSWLGTHRRRLSLSHQQKIMDKFSPFVVHKDVLSPADQPFSYAQWLKAAAARWLTPRTQLERQRRWRRSWWSSSHRTSNQDVGVRALPPSGDHDVGDHPSRGLLGSTSSRTSRAQIARCLIHQNLVRSGALVEALWEDIRCVHGDAHRNPVVPVEPIFKGKKYRLKDVVGSRLKHRLIMGTDWLCFIKPARQFVAVRSRL